MSNATKSNDELAEILCMLNEAAAIVESRLFEITLDIAHAAKAMIVMSAERLEEEMKGGGVEQASAPIWQAVAVLDAALKEKDDLALWGARRLLETAHTQLDEHCHPSREVAHG